MQPERASTEIAIVAPAHGSEPTPVFAALTPRAVRARRLASRTRGDRPAPSKPALLGLVAIVVMVACAVLALVAALRVRDGVRLGRRA